MLGLHAADYTDRAVDRRSTRCPGSRRWPGTCAATTTTRSAGPGLPARHGPERVDQLYPVYPYARTRPDPAASADAAAPAHAAATPAATAPRPAPAAGDGSPALAGGAAGASTRAGGAGRRPAPGRRGDGIGSNSWVVAGAHDRDRQAVAGQRPAPGAVASRASGTRWACTAGRCRRPARSTSPASPSPACPA